MTSFNDASAELRGRIPQMRCLPVPFTVPDVSVPLVRHLERCPYVPGDPVARDDRCREAFSIQVQGLASRLASTGISKVVIGVSGEATGARQATGMLTRGSKSWSVRSRQRHARRSHDQASTSHIP